MPQQQTIRPSFGPLETDALLEAIESEIGDASAYNEADDGPDGPEQSIVDYVTWLKSAQTTIRASRPPTHSVVIDNFDEPGRHRYSVVGLYASHEAAYTDLPRIVRDLIADPEGTKQENASHTPEELEAEVSRIASTGDGDAFGFYVWIAPWSAA